MFFYIAFVLIFLCYIIKGMIKPKNFPPGPPNLPIVGSIPFVGTNFLTGLEKLRQKYGKIFGFTVGTQKCVVVADFHLYKELATRDEFTYRPDLGPYGDVRRKDNIENYTGVMFSNGWEWNQQRRFTLRHLRDFGFGKVSMEGLIHDEIRKLMTMMSKDLNTPVSLRMKMNIPVVNALWHIMTGQTLEYDDPNLKQLVHKLDEMMTAVDSVGILNIFPWLKHIFPEATKYNTVYKAQKDCMDMVERHYKDHLKSYDPNHMRDFIDVYIREMKLADSGDDTDRLSFKGSRGLNNLLTGANDLFVGGSETTVNTINWVLYYLALHPDKQKRLQEEIKSVVGLDRLPSLEDRPKMHYTEAVVNEVFRISSLGYLGIPRTTNIDAKLNGYTIPKDTQIFCFLHFVMHDPDYWHDPETFIPERFLCDKGETFTPDERAIPFGLGKRNCLGKTLAQNEVFLFTASLFQKFSFSLPEETLKKKMDPYVGFVLGCPDYKIIIHNRE